MKFSRIYFAFVILILLNIDSIAQVREDLLPKTLTLSATLFAAPVSQVLSFDPAKSADLDSRDDKLGHMPKFARAITTDISLSNSGTWTTLPNGDRVWRCMISASGALGLIPCYDAFFIPQGAMLHVYTIIPPMVITTQGSYTEMPVWWNIMSRLLWQEWAGFI